MGDLDKAIACFQELGIKPKVDDFQSRLVMQKTVCLLQLAGIKTGFDYGIYVRGAYSSQLAHALYDKKEEVENFKTDAKLTGEEKEKLAEFKEIMQDMKPSILEIAATFAYFAYGKKMPVREATMLIKKMKPFYSESEFAIGINRAKELLFVPTEADMKLMKEEYMLWEPAMLETLRKSE